MIDESMFPKKFLNDRDFINRERLWVALRHIQKVLDDQLSYRVIGNNEKLYFILKDYEKTVIEHLKGIPRGE